MVKSGLIYIVAALFLSQQLFAVNLGVRGTIYSIKEPDMLTGIHARLDAMQESGELKRQKKAVIARSIAHILRPTPVSTVSDLKSGDTPRTHFFDPSIVLNKNIINSQGDLIAKEGTVINPLDHMHFHETLVFINSDNKDQMSWVKGLIAKFRSQSKRFKIILVNGNINTSTQYLKNRVYFDQTGSLCHKFSIIHTPTMVFQQMDNHLYIPRLVVQEVQIG
jgi:conjugal transfer pilus assembly protein TraW